MVGIKGNDNTTKPNAHQQHHTDGPECGPNLLRGTWNWYNKLWTGDKVRDKQRSNH